MRYFQLGLLIVSMMFSGVAMAQSTTKHATFAGGCFWCMEPVFSKMDGVISVTSGYTRGHIPDPSYEDITTGRTGHAEAVDVVYDPAKASYKELLEVYWSNIDPTVKDRQFCDVGSQYRTGIYYHDEEQKALAEQSKQDIATLERFKGKTIYTEIEPASTFYTAEEYHQEYYKKNPLRYSLYKNACGREKRLKEIWDE